MLLLHMEVSLIEIRTKLRTHLPLRTFCDWYFSIHINSTVADRPRDAPVYVKYQLSTQMEPRKQEDGQ